MESNRVGVACSDNIDSQASRDYMQHSAYTSCAAALSRRDTDCCNRYIDIGRLW